MRFGSPTGAINPTTNKDFGSGTAEEFYLAYERWKDDHDSVKVLVFFKEPIVVAESNTEANEQLRKVSEFKQTVQGLGWTNPFVAEDDFRRKIREALEVYGISTLR